MNRLLLFTLLSFTFLFTQCSDDPDGVDPKTSAAWVDGYPKARVGATSIDIEVKPRVPSDIFYLLTNESITVTRQQIMEEAMAPSLSSIIANGHIAVNANEGKTATITGLQQKMPYYLYIAMDNAKDTTLNNITTESLTMKVRQDTASFFSASENRNAYLLAYQPEDALKYPEKNHPVIFYLAGAGERGRDGKPINLIQNGTLPHYINKGNDVPMIVVSIQHITKEWNTALVGEGIKYVNENYPVDKTKEYLIGSSAGAFACWDYAVEHAADFAAIVPISGGGRNDLACNLKDLAVWGFHNQQDTLVGPVRTISMIEDIRACGPTKEVNLTLFPDLGHNAWRRVFDPNHVDWNKSPDVPKPDIYNWLLKHSLTTNQ